MAGRKPGLSFFTVAGVKIDGTFTAAATFVSDWMDMTEYDQPWIVDVERDGTDGDPRFTIEESPDGVEPIPGPDRGKTYNARAKNLTIPNSRFESNYRPNFMRILYFDNGATGDMTASLTRTNST